MVVGLVVCAPINSYWLARSETIGRIFFSTTSSLFCNAVFTLFVLTVFNAGVKRWRSRYALVSGELLVVYAVVSAASALSAEGVGQQLVRLLGTPFWMATPENDWAALFHRYLPNDLVVSDSRVLRAFFEGTEPSPYTSGRLTAWVRPLLSWSLLVVLLLFVMTCVNAILRRQWLEHERLSYPVIQLPLRMTREGGGFFSDGKMWLGFGIGASVTLMNGLHFLFPAVPGLQNIRNVSDLFGADPWRAMNPMYVAFYPCAVGLAYFMPLDLAFSTWFFFLVWKAELALGSAFGVGGLPGFPYARWQQTGAYLAVGVLALWTARRHLWHVLREARAGGTNPSEPMSYRVAVIGLLVGLTLTATFAVMMGMALWVALLFFGTYLVISIAITRMRAELGPLVHELYYANAGQVLTATLGPRRIPAGSLTAMSLFWWLTRSQNSNVMPHQLEAFKLSERVAMDARRIWLLLIVAGLVGVWVSSLAVLESGYREGAHPGFAVEAFERLQGWLTNDGSPDLVATTFMGVGFLAAGLLLAMKRRFLWWPLHPLGYAVTQGDWAISFIWFSIFVSWVIKWTILRWGGIQSHRKAVPLFHGLILGDFVMGATWGLIGLATGRPVYQFKNW